MGLFTKKIGPVFLKEESDSDIFIENMERLKERVEGDLKKQIEKEIKLVRYGKIGEENVAFELKNSRMDMYILHDIYLEIGGLSAQIDYLVITRKHIYVLECKNLIGNIEIDNTGSFIRTYEIFGKWVKEGIYSPITQNERHLQVLKEIRKESKGNFLTKMMFESAFDTKYKSLVVLANPKTYLNAKFAKKEVKDRVIRADQLVSYIKEKEELSKEVASTEKEMKALAEFFLEKSQPNKSDYAKKYEKLVEESAYNTSKPSTEVKKVEVQKSEDIECDIKKQLKAWRLKQSREEGNKPYFIFTDAQMEDLIKKNPQSKEELLKVSGFGEVKVEKYGDAILKILGTIQNSYKF